MVDSPAHGCLEPEVLAAYADHGLSLAERARVETHLASCPQCTALLAGVVRTVAELEPVAHAVDTEDATPLVSRRAVMGAVAAAAAVIAALALPTLVRPWLERDAGLVSLAGSAGEHRSVLGRLTGGFPHAPLAGPSAGGQDGQAAGTDRVRLTSGEIRESFGDLEAPSRLHAIGVANLLSRRYDDAAQLLLAASREQPANARYLNDVAAVHLERARLGLRPDDLPRALAAAERATRLDPSLREAWFNRALAISALSLTDQARAAWTEYLRRDSASPWAAEARQRLEELSRPTPAAAWEAVAARLEQSIDAATADAAVRAQTTEARNFIENKLFVEWASAVLAGGDGGTELERLRQMAEAMLRVTGDALYRDAVAAIDQADADGGDAFAQLADAHRGYAEAAALFSEDQHSAAAPRLAAARDKFAAVRSAYRWRAALDYSASMYFLGNAATVAPLLEELSSSAAKSNYLFVAGRARWLQGLAAFQGGRLNDSRAAYEDTLTTFVHMGDMEQQSWAHGLLASLYMSTGDQPDEWRHRNSALEGLPFTRSARFKYGILAATAFSSRGSAPEAALLIQDSALATARQWGRDAAIADILAQRSSTLLALGRLPEAEEAVAQARQHLNTVRDRAFSRIFELPILAVESDLLRRTNPQQAALAAAKAIETAQSRGDTARLPQFQLRLAKANLALGRLDEADRALTNGIAAFDATRAKPASGLGVSADDEAWQLFETAVHLAIRRGDYERAFAMTERGRAQIPAVALQRLQVPSVSEVQAMLAPDEAVIALNQFDDELAVWVIRNHASHVVTLPLRKADAGRIVARQQDEIRLQAAPGASASLYDAIVRPVVHHLPGVRRISFVPDATYQDVSFAALWDRSKRRFLVENWTVSAAPSATVLRASRSMPASSRGLDSALVLSADADVARVKAIADQYPSGELVSGGNATRAKLFAGAPVMHVAAPSYRNDRYPSLSRLVLNDEAGRSYSGEVMTDEIASRPMAATRVVVLDEFRTQQSYQSAGTFHLATAFLAAGVPAVLGTLPGADERATRELMIGFHRELAGQASAAEALSRVQRNALKQNGGRLGAWTALVIYGSDR